MTNEEAYKILMSDADFDFGKASEKNKQTADALCVAVKALKKQIPKKPIYQGDGYYDGELVYDTWFCPNCDAGYEVGTDEYNYCPNCGQAIDWSEEGEKNE